VPFLGHEQFFKGADGKLVAHTADIIGDGALPPLLIGQLHIKVRHPVHMGQVVFVQLRDKLVHLLLLALGVFIHIHGGVHKVPQGEKRLVFLRAHADIPLAVVEDAVDHGGDAGRFGLPQHRSAILGQGGSVQHTGAHGVLDIVVDKGDLIRKTHDAPLRGGCPCALGVGDDAVAYLPCQVEPFAVLFQPIHHTQALHIMVKAVRAESVQRLFTRVTKGGVPQIMRKADSLGQILVQAQAAGDGAGDLRDLQRMGQPGTVQVALRRKEHLRFLLETPEGLAVQHPVAVPLKHRAQRILRLRHNAAAACIAEGRPRRKGKVFDLFGSPAHIHTDPPFVFRASPLPSVRSRSQLLRCGNCSTSAVSKGEVRCRFAKKTLFFKMVRRTGRTPLPAHCLGSVPAAVPAAELRCAPASASAG